MAYNGRRGPNVSEYIANLNAIPSAQDMQNSNNETFLDDDLAMFTNTQFFDFDLGQDVNADLGQQELDLEGAGGKSVVDSELGLKDLEYPIQGDFAFPDFNTFAPSFEPSTENGLPHPINTSLPSDFSSALPTPTSAQSLKRKADSSVSNAGSPPESIEEASRLAAEEDKRRRNTAASARFRVKKKQREQALEKSAKEMSDKVSALEGRINMLETENKWLKNLITERNESKQDIEAHWKKYSAENGGESKAGRTEKGVGTKKVKA